MIAEWKCTACGGIVEVDDNLKHGKCKYCGTEYTEQEVVNLTNIYNHYHYNIGKVDKVEIFADENGLETQIKTATTQLEVFKDFQTAFEKFEAITQVYAYDYRGWLGMLRSYTHEFTRTDLGDHDLNIAETYYNHAISVAPQKIKSGIIQQWNQYYIKVNRYRSQRKKEIGDNENVIVEKKNQIQNLNAQIEDCQKQIYDLKQRKEKIHERIGKMTMNYYKTPTVGNNILLSIFLAILLSLALVLTCLLGTVFFLFRTPFLFLLIILVWLASLFGFFMIKQNVVHKYNNKLTEENTLEEQIHHSQQHQKNLEAQKTQLEEEINGLRNQNSDIYDSFR